MSNARIIAVTGATGAQGGGLARAILEDAGGGFTLRAITRKTDSERAKALAKAGAEVVQADLDDVESLVKAFTGAHGAYCVTNFWEHMSPGKESQQARNLADAAKRAGVKHAIWSTFEDTRDKVPLSDDRMPTLQGRYKVPHFDCKAEVNAYFLEHGPPTTLLYTSFYWDNLIHFGMGPKKGDDGKLRFVLPMADKKLPGIAAEDIGRCAYGVFKEGPSSAGQVIGVSGEQLTGHQMAASLSKALGAEVSYAAVPPAVYRGFGFPGAEDLGNMFQFKAEFESEFCGPRDPERARRFHPGLLTFDGWLKRYADKIPRA